ncbi:MAG: hypothetical protein ACOYW7_00230 [Nitrospirota bacterium]
MKKVLSLMAVIIWGLTCSVHAVKKEDIAARAEGKASNIFQEVKDGEHPPKGSADLVIKASIKSNAEGHFLIEPRKPSKQEAGYPFVLNIDGQGMMVKAESKKEDRPVHEKGKRHPEGGKGVQYAIEKKIRLAAGQHKVFFGLPEAGYAIETAITLNDGTNVLEFRPVYRRHRDNVRHFAHGLSRYEVFLNGNRVK